MLGKVTNVHLEWFLLIVLIMTVTSIEMITSANVSEVNSKVQIISKNSSNVWLQKPVVMDEYPNMNLSYETLTHTQYLEASSIIFGLSRIATKGIVNRTCFEQLKTIESGILNKEAWAMKVLDSSGTKEPGFIWGHDIWLGSQQGCQAAQQRVSLTLSNQFKRSMREGLIANTSPFDVEYRVVYVEHNSPWQVEMTTFKKRVIQIGLCLPKACGKDEVVNTVQEYMDKNLFVEENIYDLRPKVIRMKDLKISESFFQKGSLKIMIIFLCMTLLLMLFSTSLSDSQPDEQKQKESSTSSSCHQNKIMQFVMCFDLSSNWSSLISLQETTPNSIPVINGLRSISCFWLILFHVFYFMSFTVDNTPFLHSYAEQFFFQYVSSAPILVEGFFTISGFLQVNKFLKNRKQLETVRVNSLVQNARLFLKMVFHRYLRLAPLYLAVIGFVEVFTSYAEDVSVFYTYERNDELCSKYWWRNLLFIQNWFDYRELCLSWTWSMACEMQFFLLASIMLLTYAKYPRTVKGMVFAALAFNIAWTFVVGVTNQFQMSLEVFWLTANKIYTSSVVRAMPYLLGAITGWFSVEHSERVQISGQLEQKIWNFLPAVLFSCFFASFKRDTSFFVATTLYIFGRLIFSIGICWMIFCSATGRSSWYSRILEGKLFQHFNRLSYAVYLLNPFVIIFMSSFWTASIHGDMALLCVLSSGFIVIIYLMSIVFALAFEMPYCKWSSKLLLGKPKSD